jgi:hypothetical protein
LTLFGELYVSLGNFRGFSAKTVLEIFILKSGLFRGFFQFGLATLWGTQNLPDDNGPRISKLKGSLPRRQTFLNI